MAKKIGRPKGAMGQAGTIVETSITKKVAALAMMGKSRHVTAKELELTPYIVNRIWKSEDFKTYVKGLGDDAVAGAKSALRVQVSDMAGEILSAIRKQLRDKASIEAVKVALKILGFGDEEQVKQDTSIQVILPGAKREESVDAEYRVQNTKGGS